MLLAGLLVLLGVRALLEVGPLLLLLLVLLTLGPGAPLVTVHAASQLLLSIRRAELQPNDPRYKHLGWHLGYSTALVDSRPDDHLRFYSVPTKAFWNSTLKQLTPASCVHLRSINLILDDTHGV
jgi:hypothetical protein